MSSRRRRGTHYSVKYEEALSRCPEEVKEVLNHIQKGRSQAKRSRPDQYKWTYSLDYKYFSEPVTFKWTCTPSWTLCALYCGFRWRSKRIEGCPPDQYIASQMLSSFSAPYTQATNKHLIVASALRQIQALSQQDIVTPYLFSGNPVLREAAKLIAGDQ